MKTESREGQGERLILAIFLIVCAVELLRTAWISDDAYMTFRTIRNFTQGFGLTWNIAERVQVYTHPLWMLVLLPLHAATHDAFYSTAVFSILISLLVIVLFSTRVAGGFRGWLLGVVILILSKAYVDYSTSGLENPLTHLLLILYLWQYTRHDLTHRRLGWLALIAGLAATNRIDTLLIFIPSLAAAAYPLRGRKALGRIALGMLPLLVWEAFSLLYYGFPAPNPAYAKLNTGIFYPELIEQGLLYMANSANWDPLTLTAIAAGLLAPFLTSDRRSWPLAAGVMLYLLYVIGIGGDFMSGRFLTAPLLVSVVILAQALAGAPPRVAVVATVVAAVVGLASPLPPLLATSSFGADRPLVIDRNGIADERAYYFQTAGLIQHVRNHRLPYHRWYLDGMAMSDAGPVIVVRPSSGFFGYAASAQVHIVDEHGLGDPLLARLPADDNADWRIGHFVRRPPEGYVATLRMGVNQIEDPDLARYYDHLTVLTQADLFEPGRLVEILFFNTGAYDYLVDRYIARQR